MFASRTLDDCKRLHVGLAVETAVVGASATAVGAGTIIVVGKGLHLAGRALAPRATSHAAKYARTAKQHAKRWMGQIKFGDVKEAQNSVGSKQLISTVERPLAVHTEDSLAV